MSQVFHAPEGFLTSQIRVQLVGCGGTGSHLADQLARVDVTLRNLGHEGLAVELWDFDRVSTSNLGRQRFTAADVGHYKSMLLAHRINVFHGLDWKAQTTAFRPQHLRCDLLMTATDSALFRAHLGRHFRRRQSNALWIDTGNGASTGQMILGHLSGISRSAGIRLPNVFDLFPELANMQKADREEPSCSMDEAIRRQELPINLLMATSASTLLWNLLRHGQIDHHGAIIDSRPLTIRSMPIDAKTWAMYGYQSPKPSKKKAA